MKLKILIVDDEILQLKLIAKVIQSLKPEYEIASTNSSLEALKMFSLHRYDVLMTDIKMPKMDGIELIKALRETMDNDNFKIIILSGFSEFEYARTAIKYKVSDYLLKPIRKQNLIDTLDTIEKSILDSRINDKDEADDSSIPLRHEYVLYRLLTKGLISEADNVILNKEFPSGVKVCIIISSVVQDTPIVNASMESFRNYVESRYSDAISTHFSDDNMVSVVPCSITRSFDSIVTDIQSEINKLRDSGLCITVALSHNVRIINDAYLNALKYINCLRFLGSFPPLVNVTSVQKVDPVQLLSGTLDKLILSLDQEEAEDCLNAICDELRGKVFDIEKLKTGCADILRLCAERYTNSFLTKSLSLEFCNQYCTQIYNADCFMNVREAIKNFMSDIISLNKSAAEDNASQSYKLYIENNYHDPSFSLNQIASFFNYNPSYFSDLFVKMFNVTFSKYLTAYRMSQACMLLRTTNKKIYEIAQEVGMQSVSYFVKTFKEYYNESPRKYRQYIQEKHIN